MDNNKVTQIESESIYSLTNNGLTKKYSTSRDISVETEELLTCQ